MADSTTIATGSGALQGAGAGAMAGSAAGPVGTAVGAGVGALVGGGIAYMGASAADKQRKAQEAMYAAAMARLDALNIPSIESQQILLENPQMVFELAPKELQAEYLAASQEQQVQADQGLVSKQREALQQLAERGEAGFNPEEMNQYAELQRQLEAQSQARQRAIQQDMTERGMGGSGANLLARLQGEQAAANTQAQQVGDLQAQAYRRALEANMASGQMAGQLAEQQFSRDTQRARAADAISQFNAQQRAAANQYNVGTFNQAQQQMAAMKQNLENQRAQNANTQQMHNKGLIQQYYQNQFQKASGQAGQMSNMGQYYGQQAANTAQNYANMLGGLTNAATSYYGGQKDVEAADINKETAKLNYQTEALKNK